MPIYRVSAEFEIMLYAESEDEAQDEAREAVRDAMSDDPNNFDCWPTEVKGVRNLGEWHNCRPYNRDDDMTCEQIMEAEDRAEKTRPPTAAEIEAAGQLRLIAE